MNKVEIPFRYAFKDAMIRGSKTWTSRSKRYGRTGDTFEAFGQTFKILKIERRTLNDIANHWREEGCKTRDEFIDIWTKIHHRVGFNPDRRYYVHIFERISI